MALLFGVQAIQRSPRALNCNLLPIPRNSPRGWILSSKGCQSTPNTPKKIKALQQERALGFPSEIIAALVPPTYSVPITP